MCEACAVIPRLLTTIAELKNKNMVPSALVLGEHPQRAILGAVMGPVDHLPPVWARPRTVDLVRPAPTLTRYLDLPVILAEDPDALQVVVEARTIVPVALRPEDLPDTLPSECNPA